MDKITAINQFPPKFQKEKKEDPYRNIRPIAIREQKILDTFIKFGKEQEAIKIILERRNGSSSGRR